MNEPIPHLRIAAKPDDTADSEGNSGRGPVLVGDVWVRRDDSGFGIFNYRGEPVLDAPLDSPDEAARLAREIVAPWQGHVVVDDPSDG